VRSRLHPLSVLDRLLSTYWFLPAILTGGAALLAELLVTVDRAYPRNQSWLGWAYGGGADGARALLSAVAGSTITVVSVTFSVLVVALTVSSQHFGPRLLTSFMRDTPAQLVLGTFTGTFAYCLMVLRTVQGDGGDRYTFFVPHVAVTGAVALTLISIGMLIYYVHHVANGMQVSEITAAVTRDLERTVERLYPERFGEGADPPAREAPPVPQGALELTSPHSGYIQEIDSRTMLDLAVAHQTTIWLTRRPGDFVVEDAPIAAAHPPPANRGPLSHAFADAYVFGADRTARQDAAFAIQQLVEVALRALSPGVNEAFTALTCIDRLGQGLAKLARRKIPSAIRTDDLGRTRVIAHPYTFEELVIAAFEPIALDAGRTPDVSARLLETLGALAAIAPRAGDRAAIARVADLVCSVAAEHVGFAPRAARLDALHEQVRRTLARRRDGESDVGLSA
jgi:uncharacterized membrane protein